MKVLQVKAQLSPERLREFFHPKSIALVGATDNSRWSLSTFMNLKNSNFPGSVYCVHPYRDVVHGEKAYHSLLAIDEHIDLAYVMVSTKNILDVMQEAAQAHIHNLVLLTSGFSEIGEEGRELERQVFEFARAHDQLILGPNGNGFINITDQLTPYGLPLTQPLVSGSVGIVLQSGALASSVMTFAQARHVGLSLLVSMGNETMMSTTDMIDYLIEDDATQVIALFLESIRQPEEFARVARKALSRGKPIVVLKIGRSSESARTAMAHTGALVGDDAVNDAAFRGLGVVRVQSLEDLITTAGLMSYVPHLPGRRMGVVTPSGGACDILSDRAQDEHILLPAFAPETTLQLKDIVPGFSTVHNPLDVTGYVVVDRTLMLRALEVVTNDPGLDFILILMEPPRLEPDDPEPLFEQYEQMREVLKGSKCPVVFVTNTGIDITPFGRDLIDKGGMHFVGGMEHGMTALGKALWWCEKRDAYADSEKQEPVIKVKSAAAQRAAVEWSEIQTRQFLEQHGVPMVPATLATSEEEVVIAAMSIGFPVVMKIQSAEIQHKSDVGGVVLNLQSEREVKQAYVTMIEDVREKTGVNQFDGVLISPMRTEGIELLIGIIKDPLWGLTLAVGLGGIFVEVLKDTSLRILPVDRDEIKKMLEELRGAILLKGARGRIPADIDVVADAIYKVAEAAIAESDAIQALEVNPLLVQGTCVEALDALIVWNEEQ